MGNSLYQYKKNISLYAHKAMLLPNVISISEEYAIKLKPTVAVHYGKDERVVDIYFIVSESCYRQRLIWHSSSE